MIEIPVNSWHKIDIYVTKNDEQVAAGSTPTFEIINLDTGNTIRTGTASIDTNDVGHYYVQMKPSDCQEDGTLKIRWEYTLDGETIVDDEITIIYTPYAEIGEIITELELGSEPSDPNYFSYAKLRTAERLARMQINNYTGRVFGLKDGSQVTYGFGSDTILFPEKMISFSKLEQDDVVIYDSSTGYNALGYDLELTETGQGIRIKNSSSLGYSVMPPSAYYNGTKLNFVEGARYKVYGVLGYTYVPVEVKQACFLLINDHLFNDSLWRERYISKFNTGQMSVELRDSAFTGTGNLIADDLLDTYKITGIVVI